MSTRITQTKSQNVKPMIRHILLYTILFSWCVSSYSFDMRAHCIEKNKIPWNTFIDQFPFQDYLESVDLQHYLILKRDRDTLNQYFDEKGDEFINRLINRYLENYPIEIGQLEDLTYKIKLAETYYQLPDIVDDCPGVFLDMSDLLMTRISQAVEEAIVAEELHKASFEAQVMKHRLASNGYLINIPVSQWEKLIFNINEGNYAYIWDRIQKRMWIEFWTTISLFSLACVGAIIFVRKNKRRD